MIPVKSSRYAVPYFHPIICWKEFVRWSKDARPDRSRLRMFEGMPLRVVDLSRYGESQAVVTCALELHPKGPNEVNLVPT